jgi:hypothetical protein
LGAAFLSVAIMENRATMRERALENYLHNKRPGDWSATCLPLLHDVFYADALVVLRRLETRFNVSLVWDHTVDCYRVFARPSSETPACQ